MNRDNETPPSIFAPRSVEDVGERLDRLLETPCQCDENTHLNILHDLAEDDVPWLIRKLRMVEDERDQLREILAALTDPDECWFDHHGGCQAHGFLEPEPGEICPHQVAKTLLDKP